MNTKPTSDDLEQEAFLEAIANNGSSSFSSNQTDFLNSCLQTPSLSQESSKRNSSKQRRTSLEDYKQKFLQVPKINDRKPVFMSAISRERLDRIVRLFGERGMSVSGFIENLVSNHLEMYSDEIEEWRKL